MDGPGTVRLDAALGASHGAGRFGHIHFLPVTQHERFALTAWQPLDLVLDQAQRLGPAGLVGGVFGVAFVLRGEQAVEGVGVVVVRIAHAGQGREQAHPGAAYLLAAEVVVGGVLQDALKERRQFGHGTVGVFFDELEHRVLDNVQRGVVVAHGIDHLLEGPALDRGEKLRYFRSGRHGALMVACRLRRTLQGPAPATSRVLTRHADARGRCGACRRLLPRSSCGARRAGNTGTPAVVMVCLGAEVCAASGPADGRIH